MHSHLKRILETGQITDREGHRYNLSSHISIEEGLFIQEVIKNIKPKTSLEVGLAMGISTMFICEALKEVGAEKHIVIDPGQVKTARSGDNWSGLGLYNIEQCGYSSIIDFKDAPSEIILPELMTLGLKIDFAFIDGWHTFDHVLLDFFYINRMLNVGGVVIFDDSDLNSINKVINYLRNYPAYQQYNLNKQMRDSEKHSRFTWLNIYNKILKNPFRIPPLIYRNISQRLYSLVKDFCSVHILDMKGNIIISKRYFALQKTTEDSRSWDWYQNF